MYNSVIIGSIIAILIVMFLIKRTYQSTNISKQIVEEPVIICLEGPKYISREALVNILSQFERNILKIMRRVDQVNHYTLQDLSDQAYRNTSQWISKQTDPSFKDIKEKTTLDQENDIKNEQQQMKDGVTTLTDILYNSKKENDNPVEDDRDHNTKGESVSSPSKTKNSLKALSKNLALINKTISAHGCIIIGPLDIQPLEKLMDTVIKIGISNSLNFSTKNKLSIPTGRNNAQIMNCCIGSECGLNAGFNDTAAMIMGKSKRTTHCFPQFSAQNTSENRNRFKTIIR